MKTLKQYGGILLILVAVILLAATFFTENLQDPDMNHIVLGISALLVLAGVLCLIFGGKAADKIGGK